MLWLNAVVKLNYVIWSITLKKGAIVSENIWGWTHPLAPFPWLQVSTNGRLIQPEVTKHFVLFSLNWIYVSSTLYAFQDCFFTFLDTNQTKLQQWKTALAHTAIFFIYIAVIAIKSLAQSSRTARLWNAGTNAVRHTMHARKRTMRLYVSWCQDSV